MKIKIIWLPMAVILFSACGPLYSQENYVKNGDFEQVKENQATSWKSTGTIKPEVVSGIWQKMTVKFNSGANKGVSFFFVALAGSTGSIWIDNITAPRLQVKNAGFEELGPDGRPALWNIDNWNVAAFSDSSRTSDGQKSIRITHAPEASQETRVWQENLSVEPNLEYTLSFDMFVGDDFQGEAAPYIYNYPGHNGSMQENIYELFASNLAETRDRCGKYALALSPIETAPAEVSQEVSVKPGMNLQASLDINNKAFQGTARFIVEDAVSGKILKESSVKDINAKWQSLPVSFQSVSPKLRLRVIAEGKGTIQVDNAEITPPRITPPLQQVQWLPAIENFSIPSQLEVSVQGQAGAAIDGGLELLSKDLKKYNAAITRTESKEAPLKIIIGSAHEIKGKGPESYSLAVNQKGITITAGAEPGAFYGLMTLLQLMENRAGKPLILACAITDYPDMPMRGVLYGDAEQAARWKMNTFAISDNYENFAGHGRKYERWNLKVIPYFLTMDGGNRVQRINPNLATGIWVKDEKVTLNGTEPSSLANPYVIRTKLTDVKLKSSDGKEAYVLGKDYQVIDGDMALWYDNPKAKLFTVARLPGSAIPEGAIVLASYDWVSHHRSSTGRDEQHIPYVLLEPETQRLMSEAMRDLTNSYPFPYIHTSTDIHEFFVADAMLATDSRVINSGKKPIELLAENVRFLDKAVKSGNPGTRIFQWVGNVGDYARAVAPLLPRDTHINIWGYDAGWPAGYGREAVEYWSKLGFETSVMPWDNLRNVRGWAQVVAEARKKGYPCLGMIDVCWSNRGGGMEETAIVSWKIPKEGERGFVSLPKTGDGKTQK